MTHVRVVTRCEWLTASAEEAAVPGAEWAGSVTLSAPAPSPSGLRPPDGAVLVVDTSASMTGAGIRSARAAVDLFLQQAENGTCVRILSFANDTRVRFAGALTGDPERAAARAAAAAIPADGTTTDLSAGVRAGVAAAAALLQDGCRAVRFMLLTDGNPTAGLRGGELGGECARLRSALASDQVVFGVFGMGDDVGRETLQELCAHLGCESAGFVQPEDLGDVGAFLCAHYGATGVRVELTVEGEGFALAQGAAGFAVPALGAQPVVLPWSVVAAGAAPRELRLRVETRALLADGDAVHDSQLLCVRLEPGPARADPGGAELRWGLLRARVGRLLEGAAGADELAEAAAALAVFEAEAPPRSELALSVRAALDDVALARHLLAGVLDAGPTLFNLGRSLSLQRQSSGFGRHYSSPTLTRERNQYVFGEDTLGETREFEGELESLPPLRLLRQ